MAVRVQSKGLSMERKGSRVAKYEKYHAAEYQHFSKSYFLLWQGTLKEHALRTHAQALSVGEV